jgi:hypothetical protein
MPKKPYDAANDEPEGESEDDAVDRPEREELHERVAVLR